MTYTGVSLHELYRQALQDLLDAEPIEGYKATDAEVLGAQFVIADPARNLIGTAARRFNYRYMIAEMLWNTQPTDRVDVLKWVFPGVMEFIEDQREHDLMEIVAWAYGYSVWPGLEMCLQRIQADEGTRRAIIRVQEGHPYIGTPPCLVSAQFIVRGEALHMFVTMRSNDIWRGFPLDVYQFTMWQLIMASKLGLEVGSYTHVANSLHLYKRDRPAVKRFIDAPSFDLVSTIPPPQAYDEIMECLPQRSMAERNNHCTALGPWLETYLNKDTNLMPEEFRYLKEVGFGIW